MRGTVCDRSRRSHPRGIAVRVLVAAFATVGPLLTTGARGDGDSTERPAANGVEVRARLDRQLASAGLQSTSLAAGAVAFAAGLGRDLHIELIALQWMFDVAVDRRDPGLAVQCGSCLSTALERAGDSSAARRVRADIGGVLVEAEDPEGAERWLGAVVAEAEHASDREALCGALQSRAIGRAARGMLARALADAERAVEVATPLEMTQQVYAHSTLLSILVATGDTPRAVMVARELIDRSAVGSAERADAIANLGFLQYASMRRPRDAIRTLETAIEAFRARQEVAPAALAWIHLGHARLAVGELPTRELAELDRLDSRELDGMIVVHREILRGDVALRSDPSDPVAALRAFDEAIERADAAGSPYLRFEALRGRASALAALERPSECLADAREAIELVEFAVADQSDAAAGLSRAHHHAIFDLALRWAAESADARTLYEFVERARARSLLDGLASRGASFGDALPLALAERERMARFDVSVADREDRIARESGDPERARLASVQLSRAQVAYRAATESIEREARIARPGGAAPVAGLADLQRSLHPFEVFISYVTSTAPAVAIVVDRHAARIVRLGDRREVANAIDSLNFDVEDDRWREPIDVLRGALVQPLQLLPTDRFVIVCPDSGTEGVPWSLLFGPLEMKPSRALAVVPSGAIFNWIRNAPRGCACGTLAVGDPDYSASRDPRDVALFGQVTARALPGTGDEVRTLVQENEDTLLIGREATERRIREAAVTHGRWELVYFAGHGRHDREFPERSSIFLSPEPPDDGFLSAHEIARLSMPVDLVVLAACESALGTDRRGEGAFGLPRAFLRAGARSVIGSLWRVDDGATRALLAEVVRRWRSGQCPATAVAEAQRTARSDPRWSHPRYWAGWQVVGAVD